jgi:hypothetical protein
MNTSFWHGKRVLVTGHPGPTGAGRREAIA